jgi:hypothetical protein
MIYLILWLIGSALFVIGSIASDKGLSLGGLFMSILIGPVAYILLALVIYIELCDVYIIKGKKK